METRKNAVGRVPSTGAMMRMNRKLAPQTAASINRREMAMGLMGSPGPLGAGREFTLQTGPCSLPFLRLNCALGEFGRYTRANRLSLPVATG
ncbi:hypothetical protein D9M71_474770 [compost metagenome]